MSETTEFNKTGARFEGNFKFLPGMGDIIAAEGPGKGFASYPWILDKYERALGLEPSEVWLLHRMIKHYWKSGGEVFISMRKVCEEALISRKTLDKIIESLLRKGYISIVGRGRKMDDHRVRYDVSGIFNALLWSIACDPSSKYGEENGSGNIAQFFNEAPTEWEDYTEPRQLNDWYNARGQRVNWCIGKPEPLETDENGKTYQCRCERCEDDFYTISPSAKYCPACRENIRLERWRTFQRAYDEFENSMNGEEE